MKRQEIDTRGLACPEPVVLTKKALDEISAGEEILVLADTENARDNIVRFAQSQGCEVKVVEDKGYFQIGITRKTDLKPAAEPYGADCPAPEREIVYLFDSDYVGSNRDLGKVLLNGFMNAALSLPYKNCTVILISNAVKLAVKGSYALEVLEKLQHQGVSILICGTCLDFFKIRDAVAIGTVSNALEIMQRMTGAASVIKF
jgi:tRNA 2-thiouridine synthesizing protein A